MSAVPFFVEAVNVDGEGTSKIASLTLRYNQRQSDPVDIWAKHLLTGSFTMTIKDQAFVETFHPGDMLTLDLVKL
jgi:hypothetical protein